MGGWGTWPIATTKNTEETESVTDEPPSMDSGFTRGVLMLERGLLVGGRYRLEHIIGRGGMGEVWCALDEVVQTNVAVKFLRPLMGDTELVEEAYRRFLDECRVLALLRSPYIVSILDMGTIEDGRPYYVMEYLAGQSLEQKLKAEGRLSIKDTLDLMEEVARALQSAHSNQLIHRDLKPGNIFLAEFAGQKGYFVRLLDFGIAKPLNDTNFGSNTATGAFLGTPGYISPEQIEGHAELSSDIYALGIVAYQCLAGRLPFEGGVATLIGKHLHSAPPPFQSELKIPRPVSTLVMSMLAKNPSKRPDAWRLADKIRLLASQDMTGSYGLVSSLFIFVLSLLVLLVVVIALGFLGNVTAPKVEPIFDVGIVLDTDVIVEDDASSALDLPSDDVADVSSSGDLLHDVGTNQPDVGLTDKTSVRDVGIQRSSGRSTGSERKKTRTEQTNVRPRRKSPQIVDAGIKPKKNMKPDVPDAGVVQTPDVGTIPEPVKKTKPKEPILVPVVFVAGENGGAKVIYVDGVRTTGTPLKLQLPAYKSVKIGYMTTKGKWKSKLIEIPVDGARIVLE